MLENNAYGIVCIDKKIDFKVFFNFDLFYFKLAFMHSVINLVQCYHILSIF